MSAWEFNITQEPTSDWECVRTQKHGLAWKFLAQKLATASEFSLTLEPGLVLGIYSS